MLDSKRELFKWGPIDGRPIYPDFFVQSFAHHLECWGIDWLESLGYFADDKVLFIVEYWKLRDWGEILFDKYIMNPNVAKQRYEKWEATLNRLRELEKHINKGLEKDTDKELATKWKRLCEWGRDFWVTGLLPEYANWGGEQKLRRLLARHERFIELFEKLSAPEDLSFYQAEELALLKIKLSPKKEQEALLREHQQTYYWMKNSYGFTEEKEVKEFRTELETLTEEEARSKVAAITGYTQRVRAEKESLRNVVSAEAYAVARRLSFSIWWQDRRKQYIFICNHIVTKILRELARRTNIRFEELCYYTTPEIIRLTEKKERIMTAGKRRNGYLWHYHEGGTITCHEGEEAQRIIAPYLKVEIKGHGDVSGTVVSMGRERIVRGRARILLTPRDVERMKKGEILLAPMTSPDYIVAMRRAAAIVTDEGGITSHAAIVSRELGLPCIVGTRVATKLFKDGDLVEVDANHGVVRKL